MMRGLLPVPLLSLLLFVAWPVLNSSWSLGHLLLGALLALSIPWFTEALRDSRPRLRRPVLIIRLGLTVFWDILVSNLDVAKRILGAEAAIKPGFVWVPLTITDRHGIVALAGIITMTPGTLSAEITEHRSHLLVHAFHLDDEAKLIAAIKSRYEEPLRQIFEGTTQ